MWINDDAKWKWSKRTWKRRGRNHDPCTVCSPWTGRTSWWRFFFSLSLIRFLLPNTQDRYLLMLQGTKQNGKCLPPEGKKQNSTDPRTNGNVNLYNLFTFSTAFRLDFKLFFRRHCVLECFGTFYPGWVWTVTVVNALFCDILFSLISHFSCFHVFVLFVLFFTHRHYLVWSKRYLNKWKYSQLMHWLALYFTLNADIQTL